MSKICENSKFQVNKEFKKKKHPCCIFVFLPMPNKSFMLTILSITNSVCAFKLTVYHRKHRMVITAPLYGSFVIVLFDQQFVFPLSISPETAVSHVKR